MIFFLCVLTISIIFIAGVAALALAATGVVFVSGVVAGFLGMAAHRLLPWIVLAIGFCALLFVNYAGAHEFRRGSATRNHERSTNVSDSNHDPVAEFMFGRVRGHDRGILRLQRLRIPTDTFGADLSPSAGPILPASRFRSGTSERHRLLKHRKEVVRLGQARQTSPSLRGIDHRLRPAQPLAGANDLATWDLTKMCIEQVQLFQEWRRKHVPKNP